MVRRGSATTPAALHPGPEAEEKEQEKILFISMLNIKIECLERLRGFPGTWVFYALASPHFNVVEVRPRNY